MSTKHCTIYMNSPTLKSYICILSAPPAHQHTAYIHTSKQTPHTCMHIHIYMYIVQEILDKRTHTHTYTHTPTLTHTSL